VHIVAEGSESAETNKFDGREGNIVHQHSEVRATNTGDRNGSREFDRVEEVLDIVGAGVRR